MDNYVIFVQANTGNEPTIRSQLNGNVTAILVVGKTQNEVRLRVEFTLQQRNNAVTILTQLENASILTIDRTS